MSRVHRGMNAGYIPGKYIREGDRGFMAIHSDEKYALFVQVRHRSTVRNLRGGKRL